MKKLLILLVFCASSALVAQDYYEILGVSRDATADEIKAAYRAKSREFHPTAVESRLRGPKQKPPLSEDQIQQRLLEAKERFQDIQNAHEILSDPAKRKYYDERGTAPSKGFEEQQEAAEQLSRELKLFRQELKEIILEHARADFMRPNGSVARSNLVEKYKDFTKRFSDRMKLITVQVLDLARIAWALLDLLTNKPLEQSTQQRLDQIKGQITQRLQAAPSIAQPEARLKALKAIEDDNWLWTYLDQELRNQIITEAIALVRALQQANKQAEASQLTNETLKAIDEEWGRNFPVNPALRQELEQLRAARPAPQPTLRPTPPSTTPELGRQLQTLQQQLDDLSRQLGVR